MAIPNDYIDKITNKDSGESRIISPAADKVRVDNENFEGTDLDEVLDEVAESISEHHGLVNGRVPFDEATPIVLASLDGDNTDITPYSEGDYFAVLSSEKIYQVVNGAADEVGEIDDKLIYCDKSDSTLYRWNGSQFVQVGGNSGGGDGTVTGVKVGNTTYEPTDGVVDLSTPFGNKVDKVTGYGLSKNDYTDTDKAKVDGLKPVATSGSYNDLTDKPTIPTVPTMDATPTAGNTTHMVSSDGVAAAIAGKQDTLTFDNAPTANSNNVVRSGGIKQAIDEKLSEVTVNAIPAGSVAVIDGYYSDSPTDVLSAGKGKDLNDRLTEVCGGVIYEDTEVTTEETTDVTLQEGLIRTPGVGQVCDMTVDSSINFVRCAVVNLDTGNKIEIKGVGGGAARLWAVVDKTTHVIQSMETNSSSGSPWPTNPWEKTIIAETDCIVVVNVYWDNANEPYGNTSHIPPTVKLTTYTTEIVPVGTPVGGILGGMQDDIEELQDAAEGPLKGKKMVALGDSITWGFIPRNTAGAEGQMDSFAKLTAERLGMDFVNAGVVGSSVTNITGRNPMCTRYADLPNDADVVVFMGGTNDIRNGAVLGTMADRGTDTFYGALHTIMQGLYTKYIGGVAVSTGKAKKVIICTPIKLLDASKSSLANTIANNAGVLVEWDAWIDAIKEVAAFYSLPVCDMYNLSGINPHLDRTVHGTTTGYTGYYNPYITDGTHPTQEGAEMMADVLVGFIKSLR